MVEGLQFMTMVNSFVTMVYCKTCATWAPHRISQTATSGIRQDDVLILEKHPIPALPIDQRMHGSEEHLGCSPYSQHACDTEHLIQRSSCRRTHRGDAHRVYPDQSERGWSRIVGPNLTYDGCFSYFHAWPEEKEAGRICRSYSDVTVGVFFEFLCVSCSECLLQ